MLRIALFVLAVGGVTYLLIGWLGTRFGPSLSPVSRISLAAIVGVALWTVLVWRYADRIGGGDTEEE